MKMISANMNERKGICDDDNPSTKVIIESTFQIKLIPLLNNNGGALQKLVRNMLKN